MWKQVHFLLIVRGLLTLEFYFRSASEVEQPEHPVVYRVDTHVP